VAGQALGEEDEAVLEPECAAGGELLDQKVAGYSWGRSTRG